METDSQIHSLMQVRYTEEIPLAGAVSVNLWRFSR